MSEPTKAVTIRIMDRDYQISCPAGEEDALNRAARHVNEQMRELRSATRSASNEQVAVMTALNVAHELLSGQHHEAAQGLETAARIDRLTARAESALQSYRQIPL